MAPKITVQLYSVRNEAEKDYEGTMRRIAEMGYENVEPAGFPGCTVEKAAKIYKELGLSAPSQHGALPVGDHKNEIIEKALLLDTKYIFTGCPPDYPNSFKSADAIKRCADIFSEASSIAGEHGIQVGIHNHTFEMMDIEGRPAYEIFMENTPAEVLWEADIYWVCEGGRSIPAFIECIAERGKVLHFKDGLITNKNAIGLKDKAMEQFAEKCTFLPAGSGDIDLSAAFNSVEHAQYICVELDAFNGDMMEAVSQSYQYLTDHGIAEGRV